MKAWRHKEYHHVFFRETNYKKLSDGRFEAVYSPFNPDIHKLTFIGESQDDILKQVNAMFEYVDIPKPRGYAYVLKPIVIHLTCPLCNNGMEYKPDHCARHEHYMHKCRHCGYEYEMPYVHEEQVVWADAPETVLNAINNYDLEELKSIVNTKQELT